MGKIGPCFWLTLLGIIVSLVNDSICVPSVSFRNREISGRTIKFGSKEVNEYLGMRYAEPPLGPLRFQKTQKLRRVPRILKATKLRPACLQYSESPYPWYVNESKKSEDCLYLNIWTPVKAKPENKKAVLFWIHGGGFRYGSMRDPLYNGTALAAEGDIIVVTVNYRLGAFGFLTTGTDEAPGNAGLWDILEALKWVNRNIKFFGGDASRITIAGESAGAIAVGYLSISPLATGLFSQMIMESGSPAALPQETKPINLALTELLASKVRCSNDSYNFVDHIQSVTKCLKDTEAEVLAQAEREILPRSSADFLPQYGDLLMPTGPRTAVSRGEFRCKKLLIGNNQDEASLLLTTTAPEIFGFFGEKTPPINSSAAVEVFEKLAKNWLPDLQPVAKSVVPDNPLLKKASDLKPDIKSDILDNLLQKAANASLNEIYTILGDLLLVCPDEYYAEKCAENKGDVYFYWFVHRPSITPWAPWMGVAHYEEIQFVFGKPILNPGLYEEFEVELSREMVDLWSKFVKTGKPDESWPLYSEKNPVFRYLGKENSSEECDVGPHKQSCELMRLYSSLEI